MIESIAFFLSGSLLGLTLITAVLVAVILLLVRLPGAPPGMGLMALAFAVNLLRYLLLLTLPPDGMEHWLVVEAVHGAMPLLALLGAWRFVGKGRLWPWAAVAWLAMVGWLWFASSLDNPINRVIPPYLLDGLALVAAGLLFWGHGPRPGEEGRRPVGLLLILWGLHQWDFPWLLASGLSLSVGYLVSQLLSVGLAIAIILMISRHQRRFAALARAEISASALKAEASEKQLAAILERLTDGVVALDEAGVIQVLNPAAQSLFGRWQDQLLGQPGRVLLPDPRQPALPGGMIAALVAAGTAACVCKAHRSDGTPLAIELSVSEVVAGGHPFHLGVLRDISAHHQAEAIDELVLEINQRVLQGEGLEALTPSMCEQLVDLFDLNLAWVASRGLDGAVSILGSFGPDALTKALRSASHSWTGPTAADEGPTIRAIRTGGSERVDADSPLWSGRLAPYAAGGAKYALAIPLRAGLDIKGALTVYAPHPLGAEMSRHLEGLAVRIGVAAQVIADQRRLRLQGAAMAAAANAFLITDGDGHIEWVNDAFIRLSGYSLEEAQGSTPKLLRSGAQTDAFYRDLWATIKSGRPWRGELVERRKDGSLYTVEQTVTPMLDEGGVVRHFVAVHEDITNRKQAEERITYLSSYDAVTGLPNRALFRERLRQAITRAEVTGNPLAVLFLDLDHLSRINDSLGHEMGDRLLVEIVERLTQVGRTGEILARVGGDEFAMILTDQAGIEQAEVLARRMIGAVVRPCDLDGHVVHMGASIGIALYPEDGADPDSLIKNADTAMYRAIHEAPNGFRFFSTKMNDEMRERVALERDLRRALGRDEFELHYQPQFDATSGKIVGLEALLRWNHPEQGMIAPGRFIPLAEETGLIIPLGDLVLRMACRQIRDWVAADMPMVPVAVNLSAIQLQRQGLVEDVQNIIDDFAIDPRWLELELTESGVMDDAVAAERILRALDKSGIKIAIDDFGTGYSSLSYLKRFPVQKLKIDQSFVRSLAEDENDAAIARAIITLGHSLGMIVVSEGVELPSQLAYLQGQGCDVIQGFLFSRPVPARDIPPMMEKGREM